METYIAKLNNIRISPRKLVLVANLIKDLKVEAALAQLAFLNKRGAEFVGKTVKSAAANANENHGIISEDLKVKSVIVTPATTYKRGHAVSRGRYYRILKRGSNLTVELTKIN